VSIYADYTDEEQLLLRRSLQAAAVAISAASPGRKEETVSEGYAAANHILASQPAYVANTLVTSVLVELQSRLASGHVFPDYVEAATAPGALEEAIKTLHAVSAVLAARATPDEAAGYRAWLLDIARVTAQAGMEDQGFLGRGGVPVNEAERAALQAVAEALGLDPLTA
jgi:hypothetical protein